MKMKFTVLFLFCIFCHTNIGAQNNSDSIKKPKIVFPSFPGGNENIYKYMSKNLIYPSKAIKKGIEGKVFVFFTVDTTGSLTNIHITKSVNELLDSAAIRFVRGMPKWIPGEQDHKKVSIPFTLPILFTLKNYNSKKPSSSGYE